MADRDCDEEVRKVDTRRKKISFSFESVKKHFDDNISDIKNKFPLADGELAKDENLAKEIWRSQIVFLDSALDFYIHEVAKYGIIKIFNSDWEETPKYGELKVSLDFAVKLADSYENCDDLLGEIDDINHKACFMGFDNLQKILNVVGVPADKSKKGKIDELYKRRNQIAHQSDRLPDNPEKQDITKDYVEDFITLIEQFVSDINTKVEAKNT